MFSWMEKRYMQTLNLLGELVRVNMAEDQVLNLNKVTQLLKRFYAS